MAQTIDFAKVDSAFQHLAEAPEGNAALEQLGQSLDNITKTLKPSLNESEAHYLLTNLVQQRNAPFSPGLVGSKASKTLGSKVKSGFLIKTAVPE